MKFCIHALKPVTNHPRGEPLYRIENSSHWMLHWSKHDQRCLSWSNSADYITTLSMFYRWVCLQGSRVMENYHRNSSINFADNCMHWSYFLFFSTQLFKQRWTKPNHSVCISWSTQTTKQNSQWLMVGHSTILQKIFSNLHSHRCYWNMYLQF